MHVPKLRISLILQNGLGLDQNTHFGNFWNKISYHIAVDFEVQDALWKTKSNIQRHCIIIYLFFLIAFSSSYLGSPVLHIVWFDYDNVFLLLTHTFAGLCPLAEYEHSCQQQLPFVCERHNITSVERNPLQPHPGGVSCGEESVAFRDKVWSSSTLTLHVHLRHCHVQLGFSFNWLILVSLKNVCKTELLGKVKGD